MGVVMVARPHADATFCSLVSVAAKAPAKICNAMGVAVVARPQAAAKIC